MKNTKIIQFELTDSVQALVVEDVSTVKPIETLTTYDNYVFLEEVAYGGELLIISVTNKGERVRRYAIKTTELLKHAKALTRDKNKEWKKASVKELQETGMYIETI